MVIARLALRGRGNGVFGGRGSGQRTAGQGAAASAGAASAGAASAGAASAGAASAGVSQAAGERLASRERLEPPSPGAPDPADGGPGQGPRRGRLLIVAGVAIAVIAAATGYVVLHGGHSAPAGRSGRGRGTVAALKIAGITPATGTRRVDGSSPVTVQFSAPLAAGSPMPVIRPAVAGSWSTIGDDATFTPARAFRPDTRYRVTVPAAVREAGGGALGRTATAAFTTRGYSSLRLAQLLAQLGYLPVSWTPAQGTAMRSEEQDSGYITGSPQSLAFDPPAGKFRMAWGYPAMLTSQWRPDAGNVVLRGAVMAFQSEHHLTIDGTVTARLWAALFRAAAAGHRNASGYTYALASKNVPESLTIWHDGRRVFSSLANTGIPVSPTVDGTFPVYMKYRFQIMRGTNPDGSSYADPVSFVSYFNGGDAVHYFPRGSYGFQQSLGCVELPYSAAEQAYPYLTYGSLVTVAG
jgi:peptidoglycan hydrolase-like protein with peptidoglycan-binding domain